MTAVMTTDGVATAYDRWAPFYDLVFGAVFRQGRLAAIRAAEHVGARILEVGVGTGISLPLYGRNCRVYGIDISEKILDKARRRAARLNNVEAIEVMDAEMLRFADASFDVAIAQYVITAVPNPERALDELARVVRPGGEVIITTRIGADEGTRASIEKILMPITSRLGFRTEFSWERYAAWERGAPSVRLVERSPLPPLGHFELIRYRKLPGAVA